MPLTAGINHIALLTSDIDRFITFYVDVFEADLIADLNEGDLRHAFLDVGAGATLHAFTIAGNAHATGLPRMFDRGHVDHITLNVTDAATFESLRRRLVDCGASDGLVTDFGLVRTLFFRDPDGFEVEIALWQERELLRYDERIRESYVDASEPAPA